MLKKESDELIIALVRERIHRQDCQSGFLFDGFPCTLAQAIAIRNEHIVINYVIELVVDDKEIIKRLSGRRVHPASGRVYHTLYCPSKIADKDDITGEPLFQREDDQEATIHKRLQVYREQTKPLLDYYQAQNQYTDSTSPKYYSIVADGDIATTRDKIFTILDQSH